MNGRQREATRNTLVHRFAVGIPLEVRGWRETSFVKHVVR